MKQKNSTLKCLKWHSSTVRSMKKGCSVNGGHGICPLFSSPPLGIWQLKSPQPRELVIQGKKNANGGQPGGGGEGGWFGVWAQLGLIDALILVWSQKGDFRTFPLPIFLHLGLNFPYNVQMLPKLSKFTVTRVECKLHSVTRATRYCVTMRWLYEK